MLIIDPPSSSFDLTGVSKSGLVRFLNRACTAVKLVGTVHVLLTSDAEIKRLNKAFRGKNKTTDVLSFPAANEAEGIAGDLAISLETALRQAAEQGHGLREELRILLLHGLLHLAGEDHEADTGTMAARELHLRGELRLPAGLIERTEAPRTEAKRAKAARAAAAPPMARGLTVKRVRRNLVGPER